MRILSTFCILAILLFSACEEEDTVFPDEVILSCQEDVDMISPLLAGGAFDPLDPVAGFRGSITIQNSAGSCGSPITSIPFLEEYSFLLGPIFINSSDIENLDFLSNIEQFRAGISIIGCDNLTSINLPQCAEIGEFFDVRDNANVLDMQIGNDIDLELYTTIIIDSLDMISNPLLASWRPGLLDLDFALSARILDNPLLTDLSALSDLSMPTNSMEMQLYGAIINEDGENSDLDSLNMPLNTFIEAVNPGNDYSWLSKAVITPRFDEDGLDIGIIENFQISGAVTLTELCPLAQIAESTGLVAFAVENGLQTDITTEMLLTECPE